MKKFLKSNKMACKNKKGFSLVEVLCAIVLLALIATPILQAIVAGLNLNLKSRKLLAASDLTSDTSEFVSSLVFEDYTYTNAVGATVKVTGLKSFYWGNDTATLSSLKLYSQSKLYVYNIVGGGSSGPSGTYTSLSKLTGTDLNKGNGIAYNEGRRCLIEEVDMDGFKYDITIDTMKPNSTGEKYFCYDVFIYVREHGKTEVLSEARTSIANKY